jgi:RNA polymerase-binding protein DksA
MAAAKKRYTKTELNAFRKILEEEREGLQKQARDLEENSLGTSQSEQSGEMSFDEEFADAGTATFERERDLSISNNIKDLLDKIERALGKIENGSFGICERCGKSIEKARIKALPYAPLCIKDAQSEGRH